MHRSRASSCPPQAVAAACGSGTMCRPKLVPWSPAGERGVCQCVCGCACSLRFRAGTLREKAAEMQPTRPPIRTVSPHPQLPHPPTHPPTHPPMLPADGGAPLFHAVGLRHPAGVSGRDGTFVPNDITLGGTEAPPFVVLTGGCLWRSWASDAVPPMRMQACALQCTGMGTCVYDAGAAVVPSSLLQVPVPPTTDPPSHPYHWPHTPHIPPAPLQVPTWAANRRSCAKCAWRR